MKKYDTLIDAVKLLLKNHNFDCRSKSTFYRIQEENMALISFQKSLSSDKYNTKFTINIGTCSSLIKKFIEGGNLKKIVIDECHWKKRVGFLLAENVDT